MILKKRLDSWHAAMERLLCGKSDISVLPRFIRTWRSRVPVIKPKDWFFCQNKLGSVSGTWQDRDKDVPLFPVDGCD